MKKTMLKVAVATALAAPFAAHATIFEFKATLSGANEQPPNASTASGIAFLSYNDLGTASVADDLYSFTMSVTGLAAEASAFHIHGAATSTEAGAAVTENAPVRISLDAPPFLNLKSGGDLLVGGNNISPPALIPETMPSGTNAGHPPMTFLAMLTGHLAYVNVHTPLPLGVPSGEIRGQLIQVTAIPEPETYALMLAGLGLVGWAASRRRKVGV
jgi:hypothetical protein